MYGIHLSWLSCFEITLVILYVHHKTDRDLCRIHGNIGQMMQSLLGQCQGH